MALTAPLDLAGVPLGLDLCPLPAGPLDRGHDRLPDQPATVGSAAFGQRLPNLSRGDPIGPQQGSECSARPAPDWRAPWRAAP